MIARYLLPLFFILPAFFSFAQSNKSKLTDELLQSFQFETNQECLVVLKDQKVAQFPKNTYLSKEAKGKKVYENLKNHAKKTQADVIKFLEEKNIQYRSHFIVNAIYLTGELDMLLDLAAMQEVEKIVHLPRTEVQSVEEEPEEEIEAVEIVNTWGVDSIFAPLVWNMGIRGANAVVGNQDTGVEWFHPGLQPKYRGTINDSTFNHDYAWHDAIHWPEDTTGINLNPCGYDTQEPCDDHGHGTHTVGTSIGHFEEFCFGVAPEAKWIACRNMDRGNGTPETYIECFEWFLAPTMINGEQPDPSLAPDVINNSWSCPPSEGCNPSNFSFMETAVQNLKAAGVVVVVSAGNSGGQGCGSVSTPAAMFEPSFTVGSIRQNDTLSGFSSIGPVTVDSSFTLKPNVVAPGSGVRSSTRNGDFRNSSGTSMAGPHVAGLVALMVSANPMIKGQVDTIESIIEMTARQRSMTGRECFGYIGDEEFNHIYGHGRIDAYAAVLKAMEFDTNLVSNTETFITENVEIFPNPSADYLRINYDPVWFGSDIAIFDVNGRMVLESELQNLIDLRELRSGIYYLHIRSVRKNKILKLVKI